LGGPVIAEITIPLPDEDATAALGRALAPLLGPGDLVALWGELGAGKTALARAVIGALPAPGGERAAERVPSPTYTLVQTYARRPAEVWHLDLYRCADPEEVVELGWDEALAEAITLVEWPGNAGAFLPAGRLDVTLTAPDGGGRAARLHGADAGWAARLGRLNRRVAAERFVAAHGWAGAARVPLAGDASPRGYLRLVGDTETRVLMDAPPPADVRPFAHVAELLARLGFSAPAVYARDDTRGFLLLEDFGTRAVRDALAAGEPAAPLYALATDTLIALHRTGLPGEHGLPPYDTQRYLDEARLLLDWYAPAVGCTPDGEARAAWDDAWRAALACAATAEPVLVLRDFFPDNLMLLDRPGVRACGLLDFQDALAGHPAYDLASLLQDARRDVPPEREAAMLTRYLDAFPQLDAAAFRQAYTVLAAQRHAKVLGIFTRLAQRDGKPGYLQHIPRLWAYMDRCLTHPALAPVAAWLDRELPRERRVTPGHAAPS